MKGSHHLNLNSIAYRKGVIHRTKKERPFLTAKSFNTAIVQFPPPYHIINNNLHICSFTCTISHVHGRVPNYQPP